MAPTFDFDRALRRLRMWHLEFLELLGEERTVRAAAARMVLTQPALSKMLRVIDGVVGALPPDALQAGPVEAVHVEPIADDVLCVVA